MMKETYFDTDKIATMKAMVGQCRSGESKNWTDFFFKMMLFMLGTSGYICWFANYYRCPNGELWGLR